MRTIKYQPKVCLDRPVLDENGKPIKEKGKEKILPPEFSGHVELRIPTFDERYSMNSDISMESDTEGNVTVGKINPVEAIRKAVADSKKFYVAVDLKCLEDGTEYKNFEDLEIDPRCDRILTDVAGRIRVGFKPGKN